MVVDVFTLGSLFSGSGTCELAAVLCGIEPKWNSEIEPFECARLQGFPDWWVSDIPHSDTAEYKMWGIRSKTFLGFTKTMSE